VTAVVHGLGELSQAFADAGREATSELRAGLRQAADPVRRDAETLAVAKIRHMPLSPKWAEMRVGVLTRLVYVAPVKRGVKTRGADPRRRPKLADLLMERAMEPALQRNEEHSVHAVQAALDRSIDDFNRGGPR
jgi:hypothetical protein